jgi:hypothetical protein
MTAAQILFGVFGWVIGFVSAVLASLFLERRRALRAVIGACYSVELKITDHMDFKEFHRWSISVLESPFFSAIGFLNAEERIIASNAWSSLQSFDCAIYPDHDFIGMIQVQTGMASGTKPTAMRVEIEKIRSLFSKFP